MAGLHHLNLRHHYKVSQHLKYFELNLLIEQRNQVLKHSLQAY